MKIKANKLYEFMKYASINGYITELFLEFADDSVKSYMLDASNVVAAIAKLDKNTFESYEDYKEFNPLCVKDTKFLLKQLKGFGTHEIEITKNDLYLNLSTADRKVELTLAEPDLIQDKILKDKDMVLDTQVSVQIPEDKIQDIYKDFSVFNTERLELHIKNEVFTIQIGTKEFDNVVYVVDDKPSFTGDSQDVKVVLGELFPLCLNNISGTAKLELGQDMPAIIKNTQEDIETKYIIAPRVETE